MGILDGVKFTEVPPPSEISGGLPFVTHQGVLDVAGHKLRCYRLSDGKAIINADDFRAFFGALCEEPASANYVEATHSA